MRKTRPSLSLFLLFAAVSGAAFLSAKDYIVLGPPSAYSAPGAEAPVSSQVATWAAAAPGRVEPRGSQVRIGASSPGAIREVLVQLNDRVSAGDLLVRVEDDELQARLAAAKAQAAVRLNERDAYEVRGLALERRKAEDSLYAAERSAFDARLELDRVLSQLKANKASLEDVEKARAGVAAAKEKVERAQANEKRVQASEKMPAPGREEAALAAARAEVSIVSTALERMRIRAPFDATVLELNAKIGETAGPGGEIPLLVLGDTTHLQIRAEVEERDVHKIYPGQAATVKSEAFPGRAFDARVSVVAKALGAPQLAARGQRKPADVEVLEVMLDLDDGTPLLTGMRADVLFKEGDAMPKNSAIHTE
jgi:HlyD family secretion protein